jgi:hypothetical protein
VPTDTAELTRRDGVELVRTGTWAISTGTWTAGRSDLAAAVAAISCPAVRHPVLKIGHTDKRFTPGADEDGEPAIGWADNLRLADGGHTLLGDYVGVPAWLNSIMASAWPDRSIEGEYNHRCQIGHTHPFVLTAVSLLGVTPPGVGTLRSLADVQALYGLAASAEPADGVVRVAATIPGNVAARFRPDQKRDRHGRWADDASVITRTSMSIGGGKALTLGAHEDHVVSITDDAGRQVRLQRTDLAELRRTSNNTYKMEAGDVATVQHVEQRGGGPHSTLLMQVEKTGIAPDDDNDDEPYLKDTLALRLAPNVDPSYDELAASPGIELTARQLDQLVARLDAASTAERVDTGNGKVDMYTEGRATVLRPVGGAELRLDRKSVRAIDTTIDSLIDDFDENADPASVLERTVPTNAGDVTVSLRGGYQVGDLSIQPHALDVAIIVSPEHQREFGTVFGALADDAIAAKAKRTQGRVVVAAAEVTTGAMIALIPSDEDAQRLAVVGGEPVDQLHATLMYLGTADQIPDKVRAWLTDAVSRATVGVPPIDADAFSVSVFNPTSDQRDTAIVLGLGGTDVDAVHSVIVSAVRDVAASSLLDVPPQHEPWVAHLTLTYSDDLTQVAALVDRTGPITFDRIRVVFGGDVTDIPLTATDLADMPLPVAASDGEDIMPNPTPSLADRVRDAWNSTQPHDQWIVEQDAEAVIVMSEATRTFARIPVVVDGEQVAFGEPVAVLPGYVAAGSVTASVVYASRDESRPTLAASELPGDPAEQDLQPVDEPNPITAPEADPELPAAEPEPITEPKEEDHVSDLSEFRSRLGLADDADEAAVLAAFDARLQPTEPTTDTVAAAAKHKETEKEVAVLAAQVQAMSAKLSAAEADKVATVKASVIGDAVKAGKISPADQPQWEADYDEAPNAITRVLASIAAGTAVPVNASGYTGSTETGRDDDAEFEAMMARLDGPTAVKGN